MTFTYAEIFPRHVLGPKYKHDKLWVMNNSTLSKGYLRTFISFIAALVLAGVISLAPLVAFRLVNHNSSGEGSFWSGLALITVSAGMFIILTVALTYIIVAASLRRAGLAKSRETAVLCLGMLPLSGFVVTIPFIPLLARNLAIQGKGIPKQAVIPLAIVLFIGGIAGNNWYGNYRESVNLARNYANMNSEKDRLLGSQYQLIRTSHNAGSPNATYTFAASGTYESLTSSMMAALQKNGYVLQPSGLKDNLIDCKKGPNTAMAWECSFSGLKAKYQSSVYVTFAGTAAPAPNTLVPHTPDGFSEASALEGGSPVQEFSLSLWNQTSTP